MSNVTAMPGPTMPDPTIAEQCARIVAAPWFTKSILVAIALTGILSGLETYQAFRGPDTLGRTVDFLQHAVLAVFVIEIVLRIGSYGEHPWRYFQRGWNLFDFFIVALCLLPLSTEYVVVLRLLRTLRLFTALHGLQIMLSGLLRSIPSLGYVGLLLLLHFYIYAVIGTFLFGDNDPIRFGSLHTTMLSLFQVLTLEGWNDILTTQYHGSEVGYDEAWKQLASAGGDRVSVARPVAAAVYFVSFILIGTMIMLNLFTGVIIRSMEEAHIEAAEDKNRVTRRAADPSPQDRVQELGAQLQAIALQLSSLQMPASMGELRKFDDPPPSPLETGGPIEPAKPAA